MATTKKKEPKEKINIMGEKYKVEKPVSDTLKALSEALHAHEVALLTWVHKDYNGSDTPSEAANILVRMKELDEQHASDKENEGQEEEKGAKE
jgi:hypothetical protein